LVLCNSVKNHSNTASAVDCIGAAYNINFQKFSEKQRKTKETRITVESGKELCKTIDVCINVKMALKNLIPMSAELSIK
jgi:hypothetical protein